MNWKHETLLVKIIIEIMLDVSNKICESVNIWIKSVIYNLTFENPLSKFYIKVWIIYWHYTGL